jgi:hypothetical protein
MKSSLALVYDQEQGTIKMLTQLNPPKISHFEFSARKPPTSIAGIINSYAFENFLIPQMTRPLTLNPVPSP